MRFGMKAWCYSKSFLFPAQTGHAELNCGKLIVYFPQPGNVFFTWEFTLVDLGYQKHYRVHHGNNEFSNGEKHIHGIESFWSYAKRGS